MYPVDPYGLAMMILGAESPGVPPSGFEVFAGYGVVGAVAIGGIVFAWKVWSRTEAERAAYLVANTELHKALLTQAESHKNELIRVHETVMPPLASAVDVLKQASSLIERLQRDRDGR